MDKKKTLYFILMFLPLFILYCILLFVCLVVCVIVARVLESKKENCATINFDNLILDVNMATDIALSVNLFHPSEGDSWTAPRTPLRDLPRKAQGRCP